jgi:hypothetical protein
LVELSKRFAVLLGFGARLFERLDERFNPRQLRGEELRFRRHLRGMVAQH